MVIHSPNNKHPTWVNLIKTINTRTKPAQLTDKLTIITWNNLEEGIAEKSMKRLKVPFNTYGKGVIQWNNLMKFAYNINSCEEITTPYIMGIDSRDVFVLSSPVEIIETFEKMSCELIFNGESKFYPDFPPAYYQNCKSFQSKIANSKYCYLNSGSWIGKKEFCKEFFNECLKVKVWEIFDCSQWPKLHNCDQSVVHSQFTKYYPKTQIDYNCSIFQNLANSYQSEFAVYSSHLILLQ